MNSLIIPGTQCLVFPKSDKELVHTFLWLLKEISLVKSLQGAEADCRDDGKLDQSNVVKKSSTSSESYIILNSLGSGGKLEPYV